MSAVAAHLEHLQWRHYSTATIYQRGIVLRRFERLSAVEVLEASVEQIVKVLGRLRNASSKKAERSHLAGFYRWALLAGLRVDDPMLHIPPPRVPRGIPHPMPEHELMRAVSGAPERVRPWLLLAAFAGLRAAEIAGLRGEDVWWHTDPPLLVVRKAKGGDEQTVPLSPILRDELRHYPRKGWLFARADGRLGPNQPWTVSGLSNDYLHRIGINLTLHSLRHRFGTQVYRASGRDLRQTQELMRHRSIASTVVYTAVDKGEAAGIVALLPALVTASG